MSTRFLSHFIHGALDYIVAVTLVVVPFVLDFRADSEFAHWLSVVAGVGLFAYSLLTDYRAGVAQVIPFTVHLVFDFAAGAVFVVPAALGVFEPTPTLFYAVMGVAVMIVALVTQTGDEPVAVAA